MAQYLRFRKEVGELKGLLEVERNADPTPPRSCAACNQTHPHRPERRHAVVYFTALSNPVWPRPIRTRSTLPRVAPSHHPFHPVPSHSISSHACLMLSRTHLSHPARPGPVLSHPVLSRLFCPLTPRAVRSHPIFPPVISRRIPSLHILFLPTRHVPLATSPPIASNPISSIFRSHSGPILFHPRRCKRGGKPSATAELSASSSVVEPNEAQDGGGAQGGKPTQEHSAAMEGNAEFALVGSKRRRAEANPECQQPSISSEDSALRVFELSVLIWQVYSPNLADRAHIWQAYPRPLGTSGSCCVDDDGQQRALARWSSLIQLCAEEQKTPTELQTAGSGREASYLGRAVGNDGSGRS